MRDEDLKRLLGEIDAAAPAEVYVTTKEQWDHPPARWTVRREHANGNARLITDDQLRALVREVLVLRAYRREMQGAERAAGVRTPAAETDVVQLVAALERELADARARNEVLRSSLAEVSERAQEAMRWRDTWRDDAAAQRARAEKAEGGRDALRADVLAQRAELESARAWARRWKRLARATKRYARDLLNPPEAPWTHRHESDGRCQFLDCETAEETGTPPPADYNCNGVQACAGCAEDYRKHSPDLVKPLAAGAKEGGDRG